LQKLEFLLTLEMPVTNGCDHFEFGCERAQRHFEPDLIVTGRRAAMGDAAGTQLSRHERDGLSLHDAFRTDAQGIKLAAPDVSHDEKAQYLIKVIGASIDLVMRNGPQSQCTLLECFGGARIDPAGIDSDRDDRALILLLEPGDEERGIEAARIGENDGLGHGNP
jgi:hypothetical protein